MCVLARLVTSRCDGGGPAGYCNDLRSGEHAGTHPPARVRALVERR